MSAVNLLPFVGDVGRRFTIERTGERPNTINGIVGRHRMVFVNYTKKMRNLWADIGRTANLPHLNRCVIVATPLHQDRRSPQDCGACAPEVKAAIDGLVAGMVTRPYSATEGLLPDDGPKHLITLAFMQPEICGVNGLRLTIYEIL